MTQAIPVYIINLKRRVDRLERLGGQLDALGIGWQRVDALDAGLATDQQIDAVINAEGPLGRIGKGDRACTVSHLRAWQMLLETDSPFALVLEDDVYLSGDALELVASTDWIPPDVDVVKLEKFGDRESMVLLGPAIGSLNGGTRLLHRMHSRHVGGAAYILSRRAAKEGLKLSGSIRVPVDHLLFNATVSSLSGNLKPVLIRPAMATQRRFGYNSDIASLGKAIRPHGWKLWKRRVKRGFYEVRLLPLQICLFLFGRAKLLPLTWEENVGNRGSVKK